MWVQIPSSLPIKILKIMKKIITLLSLMFLSLVSYSQKPMVGFTESDIKSYNNIKFGTNKWEKKFESDFWYVCTVNPDYDLVSFYYFKYGETKNTLFVNATNDRDIASEIVKKLREDHIFLGNNKYFNKENGLTVHCIYHDEKEVFTFSYYFE
jgi:hypothetical protein